MSDKLEEITVIGVISETGGRYVVTTDDGTRYELSAIMPWTAVSADYGTREFRAFLGERARVTGMTDGSTIYGANVTKA